MKLVRFTAGGKVKCGELREGSIHSLARSPFAGFRGPGSRLAFDGGVHRLEDVNLLPPCLPSKVVCLGLNYRTHAEETKLALPTVPLIFLKPSTAVIGPEASIVLPRQAGRVDYEGEMGVVIGRRARDVIEDKALEYVLGYTCVNDVSERHNQKEDGQWTRAKGYDTFAPIGPCIETGIDPHDVRLETWLNGEVRQSARTSDLIFPVERLIAFITAVMTLLPCDIISTGTPAGIGRMAAGDVVEVRIEGIGTLRNTVASAPGC